MIRHIALILAFSYSISALQAEDGKPIFDGKTFKGWEGNLDFFTIKDKTIIAGSKKDKIPRNEFLCTTKEYENFELRLKAKLIGEGKNAGIQFRSKRIPNHHEVIGFQCDIGQSNRSIWGSLYDESRRRKFLAEGDAKKLEKVVKRGDWNEFVICCEGDHIQIWVNGYQTVDYTEKEKDIATSGIIGLQIHSGPPAQAMYKDIRITELKPKKK